MALDMERGATAPPSAMKHTRLDLPTIAPFVLFAVIYALAPRFLEQKDLTLLIYIGINALIALGLNLLMGYAGQISLGHAAFFGMGAYTSAILTVRPIPEEVMPGFSLGTGVLAGLAVLVSLTRASGWRFAVGLGALLAFAWFAGALQAGLLVSLVIFGIGMAVTGLVTGLGWLKAGAAGVCVVVVSAVSHSFLTGVLARGGTSPWLGMIVGVFFTGMIAYLIGAQVLRLKGHYLAMATLGFGIIVEIIFRQWTAVTGGSSDGIFGIPTISFTDGLPAPIRSLYELAAGGPLGPREQYFYLVWLFVFVGLILAVNIVRSRVGRAFRAVHGSEVAAESLGVDTERYKVQVFVLSAALGSIAGSLHAHNAGIGYVNPSEFNFMVSVQLVVMVVVGGMASVWGALFGAAAIQLLKNWILNIGKSGHEFMGLTLTGLDPIIFGSILIIVMIILPQGLVRGLTDAAAAAFRTAGKGGRHGTG